jgi:excisionase family DNA binding protein
MDGYLTVQETARRLGRSIEQVRRYLREGALPGRRIGQQWFVDEQALDGWRPPDRRGSTGTRMGDAVATYEVSTMRTAETRNREGLTVQAVLAEIDRLREQIRGERGNLDVIEMLRRDREEH